MKQYFDFPVLFFTKITASPKPKQVLCKRRISKKAHVTRVDDFMQLKGAILQGDHHAVYEYHLYLEGENDYYDELEGLTPLLFACKYSNVEVVDVLVENVGCDLFVPCQEFGYSCLDYVFHNNWENYREILCYLLKKAFEEANN